MAADAKIHITGSPIELLQNIKIEIVSIVENYQQQLDIVNDINLITENYLDNLIRIEDVQKNILKLEKERKDNNDKISTINEDINKSLSEQEKNQESINEKLKEELNTLLDNKKKYEEIDKQIASIIKKNKDNLKLLEQSSQQTSNINSTLNDSNDTTSKSNKTWGKIKEVLKKVYGIAEDIAITYGKQDSAISKINAQWGLSTAQLDGYKLAIRSAALETRLMYGIGPEELIKLQSSYNSEIGRTIQLSKDSSIALAAMSKIVGEDNAVKFVSEMDKFGLSVSSSMDFMQEITDTAKKGGVDIQKATNLVQSNLKLANKYNFKDGINGLSRMATYSLQTRMNMEQVAAFADKVDNVEGAIETGAKLQVLGGSFAAFADPLQMMYESLNDFESLGKRMEGMFKDNMYFDSSTGTMTASVIDKQRMKAAAKEMGLDYNEMFTMAQTTKMRDFLSSKIDFSTLGSSNIEGTNGNTHQYTVEEKNLLTSIAKWNQKANNGQGAATVSVLADAKDVEEGRAKQEGDMIDKDIKSLTKEQLSYLKPQKETIKDIAKSTQGIYDTIQNMKGFSKETFGEQIEKHFGTSVRLGLKTFQDFSNENKIISSLIITAISSLGAGAIIGGGLKIIGKGVKWGYNKIRGRSSSTTSGRGGGSNSGRGSGSNNSGNARGRVNTGNTQGRSFVREGLRQNSRGQWIDSRGRFVSNSRIQGIRSTMGGLGGNAQHQNAYRGLRNIGTGAKTARAISSAIKPVAGVAKVGGAALSGVTAGAMTGLEHWGQGNFEKDSGMKGTAIGETIGAAAGGVAGAALMAWAGPIGMALGGMAGAWLGKKAGGWIGEFFDKKEDRIKNLNTKEGRAYSKLQASENFMKAINETDDELLVLKEIAKSTYTIESVLKDKWKYEGVLSKEDKERLEKAKVDFNTFENFSGDPFRSYKSVNDGIIDKNGNVTKFDNNDQILAAKPGGAIDNLINEIKPKPLPFQGQSIKNTNYGTPLSSNNNQINKPIEVNINGTIKLDLGKGNVVDGKDIVNNPVFIRQITNLVANQLNVNDNSGKIKGGINKYNLY